MKAVLAWIGPLVFLGLVVNFAFKFGTCWEFGRLGMPATLLAKNGRHHPDGTEVESVTLLIANSGYEQEIYLVAVMVWAGLVAWLVKEMCRLHRMELEQNRMMRQRYLQRRDGA